MGPHNTTQLEDKQESFSPSTFGLGATNVWRVLVGAALAVLASAADDQARENRVILGNVVPPTLVLHFGLVGKDHIRARGEAAAALIGSAPGLSVPEQSRYANKQLL